MNDNPIDLSSLDPTRDRTRFDAVAGAIARDAMAARARRADERRDMAGAVAAWSRPALIAAAVVVAAAVPLLTRSGSREAPAPRASSVNALGIPGELTDLLRSGRTPSLTELHEALAAVGK